MGEYTEKHIKLFQLAQNQATLYLFLKSLLEKKYA